MLTISYPSHWYIETLVIVRTLGYLSLVIEIFKSFICNMMMYRELLSHIVDQSEWLNLYRLSQSEIIERSYQES